MKENESKRFPQYIAAFIMSLMAFTTGIALGWPSPSGPILQNPPNNTNNSNILEQYDFEMTTDEFSLAAGAINLGGSLMSMPLGYIIKKVGCRSTIFILSIPITVGWLLILLAKNSAMLIIGRFISGLAASSYLLCISIYIGEISDKTIRGTLGSLLEMQTKFGIFIIYILGYFFTIPMMTLICMIISLISTGLLLFIPESPYFWIAKKRKEEANKSLKWLRGVNFDTVLEIERIEKHIEELASFDVSVCVNLQKRASLKTIFIGSGLMFVFQMCGMNAIQFYTTTIFIAAKIDIEPEFGTMIIGATQFLALFPAACLIDRLGRRILLIISGAGMAISIIAIGFFFFYHDLDETLMINYRWIPLVSLIVFVIMNCSGYGIIVWIMLGEIFTPEIKNIGTAIVATFSWFMGFIVAIVFPALTYIIGPGPTFWFFSCFSIIGVLFPIFFVPETKGKTLEEVQLMIAGKSVNQNNRNTIIGNDTNC